MLSVVITWRDRFELSRTLQLNNTWISSTGSQLIIVNAGGRMEDLTAIIQEVDCDASAIDSRLPCFNKAAAVNIGLEHASGEQVLLLDADVYLSSHAIGSLTSACTPTSFATVEQLKETDAVVHTGAPFSRWEPYALKDVTNEHRMRIEWQDGDVNEVMLHKSQLLSGWRAGTGTLCATWNALRAVGGLCSSLEGWGFEDIDIMLRLQRVARLTHHEVACATHLSHPDAVRDLRGSSRHHRHTNNLQTALERYNKGQMNGTWPQDVDNFRKRTNP